jgi:hypothetical protein
VEEQYKAVLPKFGTADQSLFIVGLYFYFPVIKNILYKETS